MVTTQEENSKATLMAADTETALYSYCAQWRLGHYLLRLVNQTLKYWLILELFIMLWTWLRGTFWKAEKNALNDVAATSKFTYLPPIIHCSLKVNSTPLSKHMRLDSPCGLNSLLLIGKGPLWNWMYYESDLMQTMQRLTRCLILLL